MPFPCHKCERAGAICSGIEGERCGRCRAIRKPCSHNAQPRPSRSKSDPPLRARFAIPVSSSTFVKGPAAALAFGAKKDERLEALNKRPGSDLNPSDVLKTSAACSSKSRLSLFIWKKLSRWVLQPLFYLNHRQVELRMTFHLSPRMKMTMLWRNLWIAKEERRKMWALRPLASGLHRWILWHLR